MQFTLMKRLWVEVKIVKPSLGEIFGFFPWDPEREILVDGQNLFLSEEEIAIYRILERAGSSGLSDSQIANELPCSWHVARRILRSLFDKGLTGVFEKKAETTSPDYIYKVYGRYKRFD